jgi:hypothetical protein
VPVDRRLRRPSTGLILAIVLPALVAGATVLLVGRHRAEPAPPAHTASPSALARAAARRDPAAGALSLRPLHPRPGVSGVQPQRLQGISGGIRPAAPVTVSIPAAHVQTAIDAVHTRHGALRVPHIGRAGWYAAGPRPGEPGKAVLIGHLDTRHGPGLFADVPKVRRGAAVAVADERGDVYRFRVVGAAQVPKDRFPTSAVYGPSRAPVLVLITCGGPFDVRTGHYRDNVLVYARAL